MPLIPKKMKSVVHISTRDQWGGAAIAAWRLHEGMQGLGVDSRVVCRRPSSVTWDVSSLTTPLFEALDLFNQELVNPAQPEGATLFSLSPLSLPLLDHPWIAAADVIHLHWVAQFIAPEDIAELCKAGKTIFWTFHDQWPYTGGCHYIGGSTRHESDWDGSAQIGPSIHEFARLELQRKKQAFKDMPIHVIAPSRWMAEEAVASGVFRQEQVHVVPYGINTSVFYPYRFRGNSPKEDQHKVDLLFGCQCVGDLRKGYNEFRQALILCMLDARFSAAVADGLIRVQTFGELPESGMDLPIPVTHLGMLLGELKVAELLRSSSAFICPTLEDNLPNVVMESLACGCPVVAFATGGVPDMVTHDKNGLLAPKGDCEALSRHLIDFCLDEPLRQRLRNHTRQTNLENCSLETQATRILELYEVVSPTPDGTNHSTIPDCPPSLPIKARILPHYGTEMTLMLLGVKDLLESRCSAQSEESYTKLTHAWDQVSSSRERISEIEKHLLEFQKQQTASDNEYKLLLLQLRQTQDELEAYFLDNRRLTKLNAKSQLSAEKERLKAQQIKQQLSYRLGSTIVTRSRSFGGWLGMPFSLIGETIRYRDHLKNKLSQKNQDPRKKGPSKTAGRPGTANASDAAVARVKQQLSYRIGNAFVRNARSPVGWIRLPFAVAGEIINFKKTKTKLKGKPQRSAR